RKGTVFSLRKGESWQNKLGPANHENGQVLVLPKQSWTKGHLGMEIGLKGCGVYRARTSGREDARDWGRG
ncbi:hypothetical protein KI387_042996, partial [Taxus chinensis]